MGTVAVLTEGCWKEVPPIVQAHPWGVCSAALQQASQLRATQCICDMAGPRRVHMAHPWPGGLP